MKIHVWRTVGVILSICINIFVIISVIILFIYYFCTRDASFMLQSWTAAELYKMKVYAFRSPFSILVDKDYPQKSNMFLLVKNRKNILIGMEGFREHDLESKISVMVASNQNYDFSFQCKLDIQHSNAVYETTFSRGEFDYIDLNADGVPDERTTMSKIGVDIYLNGQWLATNIKGAGTNRFSKVLMGGQKVIFNHARGIWGLVVERTREDQRGP